MISGIVKGIVDGIFQAAFGWISHYLEKRGLIEQGKSEQYQADLKATVNAGIGATNIRTNVDKSSDASVDSYLRSLRDNQSSSNK